MKKRNYPEFARRGEMADIMSLQATLYKVGKLDKLQIYAQMIQLRCQERDNDFIQDFRSAIHIFEEYLTFDSKPGESSCWCILEMFYFAFQASRFYARGNHFQEIYAAFERYKKLFKDPILLAQIHDHLSYFFLQQQKKDEAINYAQKSIKLADASGRTDILIGRYSNLGFIYESFDELDLAQKWYEEQLQFGLEKHLDQAVFLAYCGFGRLNICSANFPAAVNYLLEALNYFADESSEKVMAVYLNLGTAYGRMCEYKDSLKYLNKFITDEVRAQHPEMYFSFLINAANCYLNTKDFDKAEANWQLALSLAKQHNNTEAITSVLLNFGLCELNRENWQNAQMKLEECLSFTGLNSAQKIMAFQGLGIAYYHLGDSEKAKDCLVEVITKAADQKRKLGINNSFRTLIDIFEAEEDFKNALFYFRKFMKFELELLDAKYKLELEKIQQKEHQKRNKTPDVFSYQTNSLISQELARKIKTPFIGVSSVIKKVVDLAMIAAKQEDIPVLITGESGTGKEIVSRLIHFAGSRSNNPFIVVNSAAITESLSESLFFGNEKGAYTGADKRKIGYFEAAHEGTLFLDEIGDLSLSLQAKLLRVIEEKVIHRLGSTIEYKTNFRLVSATNQDINQLSKKNLFRFDLLNRINALEIQIPPLRERLDDIPFLIDYFISELCHQSNREKPLLTKDAMLLLLEYHYPGNVRELRNIINRSLMLHTKPVLAVEDILLSRQSTSQMQVYDDFEGNVHLAQAQERLIRIAMHKCNNVQAKAAKLLGISPSSLNRKLKKMTF